MMPYSSKATVSWSRSSALVSLSLLISLLSHPLCNSLVSFALLICHHYYACSSFRLSLSSLIMLVGALNTNLKQHHARQTNGTRDANGCLICTNLHPSCSCTINEECVYINRCVSPAMLCPISTPSTCGDPVVQRLQPMPRGNVHSEGGGQLVVQGGCQWRCSRRSSRRDHPRARCDGGRLLLVPPASTHARSSCCRR